MTDIQNHFSHSVHSREWAAFRFRQSPVRLAEHEFIVLSDATFVIYHFLVVGLLWVST